MRIVSAIAGLSMVCAAALLGQVSSGTINVIAQDSTQAVVPNATVTVTNKNTGLTRVGQTGPTGEFAATFLPAGEYSISVQAQAFKRSTIGQFTLQVDQNATVRMSAHARRRRRNRASDRIHAAARSRDLLARVRSSRTRKFWICR